MELKTCLALLLFVSAQASVLPVEKCTLTDKSCMIAAAQKMMPVFAAGMPEYGVEVLDPMALYDLKFDLAGLQFSMTGATMKGLKNVIVNEFDWDTNKNIFAIGIAGDISVKGHYTAGGQVLILPITGDGQIKIKMKNLHIKLFIHFAMEDGYVKPTKYSFEFDIKDSCQYQLTNLFNGNKELSDAMLFFLNDNWKQLSTQFGRPMMDNAAKQFFNNIASFLGKLPIAEIANV